MHSRAASLVFTAALWGGVAPASAQRPASPPPSPVPLDRLGDHLSKDFEKFGAEMSRWGEQLGRDLGRVGRDLDGAGREIGRAAREATRAGDAFDRAWERGDFTATTRPGGDPGAPGRIGVVTRPVPPPNRSWGEAAPPEPPDPPGRAAPAPPADPAPPAARPSPSPGVLPPPSPGALPPPGRVPPAPAGFPWWKVLGVAGVFALIAAAGRAWARRRGAGGPHADPGRDSAGSGADGVAVPAAPGAGRGLGATRVSAAGASQRDATRVSAPAAEPRLAGGPRDATRVSAPAPAGKPAAVTRPPTAADGAAPGVAGGPASGPAGAPAGSLPRWLGALLEGALPARYTGLRPLGAGGMGVVVYAFDDRLKRPVALKVPPPHLAALPEFRARFLREARALARLDHPNVSRVYDVLDEADGETPVMVMEYLEGRELAAVVREARPPVATGVGYIRQMGEGLQYIHDQGVVHRDFKLSNLMLVGDRVKILDFGLAAMDDGTKLTKTGAVGGSVHIMPPEQMRGEPVDHRADVYSLAVCAFEVLTGRLPFEPEDRIRRHIPRIHAERPGLPPQLDAIFDAALAPQPAARTGSAREFVAAVTRALGGAGAAAG